MELLCQQRALNLFKLSSQEWAVNVQPYSGSPANFGVYTALLKPHDRIMGLDLPSGGHLTHGYQTNKRKVSATSVYFESMPYKVDRRSGLINYDELASLATAFKPKLIIAGASAYPRDWDYARMRSIADSVGAFLMADIAHIAGFVATNLLASPFEHCDVVTTTTHKSLRGPRAGMIFSRVALKDAVDQAVFPGLQGGPHNNNIGKGELIFIVYAFFSLCLFTIIHIFLFIFFLTCFIIQYMTNFRYAAAVAIALYEAAHPSYTKYMKQVRANAAELGRCLKRAGCDIATGGTSNHIVLWNTAHIPSVGLSGAKMEKLLEMVDISVNKNTLPSDVSALNPGGVRLGTLAMTTRGVQKSEMNIIADFLLQVAKVGQEIEHFTTPAIQSTQTKKLKEFVECAKQQEFVEKLEQIRREVNLFTATLKPVP